MKGHNTNGHKEAKCKGTQIKGHNTNRRKQRDTHIQTNTHTYRKQQQQQRKPRDTNKGAQYQETQKRDTIPRHAKKGHNTKRCKQRDTMPKGTKGHNTKGIRQYFIRILHSLADVLIWPYRRSCFTIFLSSSRIWTATEAQPQNFTGCHFWLSLVIPKDIIQSEVKLTGTDTTVQFLFRFFPLVCAQTHCGEEEQQDDDLSKVLAL